MTKETWTYFAFSFAFVGLMLSTSPCHAQSNLPGLRGIRHQPSTASQPTTQLTGTTPLSSPTFAFTTFNVPGSLQAFGFGINSGAASSKIEIVGGVGSNASPGPIGYSGGFHMHYSQTKTTTTETFRGVNFPGAIQQAASGVNDSGEIVGYYSDSLGVVRGYLESGGTFSIIDVPFSGATATGAFAINNAGQIAGFWNDATQSHGFLLSGGKYTSIDYPGAVFTVVDDINNSGEMAGTYGDTSSVEHGFSLSSGIYTTIDPPGSTSTAASGINDAGDIVGAYCLTSECAANFDTTQGFLLSGGTYTTITIPGATAIEAVGINNKGVIVGAYFDAVGSSGFLAIPK
jgi:hypothetical protein